MKNEHIVQFLQAFPFNPSCNQLLQKLDEYCQAKTTPVEQNYDLKDNPSNKAKHLSKLFKLFDLRHYFTNKVNNVNSADIFDNKDNTINTGHGENKHQNVYKVEMHMYDLLFLVQKIKLGLETSEDVYKIMTDEKSKTQIFVPLYFEIVTNNGEDDTYLELIQDEKYPSFGEIYSKNTSDGFELNEFLNLNIYFSYFISFLISWLCKQDILEEKGKPDFIKFFRYFVQTQDKITDFVKNLG